MHVDFRHTKEFQLSLVSCVWEWDGDATNIQAVCGFRDTTIKERVTYWWVTVNSLVLRWPAHRVRGGRTKNTSTNTGSSPELLSLAVQSINVTTTEAKPEPPAFPIWASEGIPESTSAPAPLARCRGSWSARNPVTPTQPWLRSCYDSWLAGTILAVHSGSLSVGSPWSIPLCFTMGMVFFGWCALLFFAKHTFYNFVQKVQA